MPQLCWHTPAGTLQPLRFTLEYAAPEVVSAWEGGAATGRADTAADIWAFGVTAYEALTRAPAWPRKAAESDITNALAGRAPLPWERQALDAPNNFRARVKGIVLECLHRDPAQRPAAGALAQALQAASGAASA